MYQVKVLGILGMVDGGEMDWKVVTVAVSDPLAAILDGVLSLDVCGCMCVKHLTGPAVCRCGRGCP